MEARRIKRDGKRTVTLRAVPKDVTDMILDCQTEMKKKCDCLFSKEKTVYMIIRKWKAIKDYRINGVPASKIVDELFTVKKLP